METSQTELAKEIWRWQGKILQLPTPESQTMEWLPFDRILRQRGVHWSDLRMRLECDGFAIYLQAKGWVRDANLVCLTLGSVGVPEQHQRKGWFKHYVNMCCALMPHEGLILEQVTNTKLYDWLTRQPQYERVDMSFLRRKPGVTS